MDISSVRNTFNIVVDGGGTKTAATIIGEHDNRYFKGHGGPGNICSSDSAIVLESIAFAIEDALRARAEQLKFDFNESLKVLDLSVNKLYVGLAGGLSVDEIKLKEFKNTITSLFSKVYYVQVVSDLFLLPLAVPNKSVVKYAIALIAGTGSSSLCFKYNDDGNVILIGRSGGWGPNFGDKGAGYSIGMRSIKATLRAIDEYNIKKNLNKFPRLDTIYQRIFQHIVGTKYDGNNGSQFFNTIDKLLKEPSNIGDTRKRIASLTKIIFDELNDDELNRAIAQKLLVNENKHLYQIIVPFLDQINPSETCLVLSGSLFSLPQYYQLFLENLRASNISFRDIIVVDDPSVSAIKQLATQ